MSEGERMALDAMDSEFEEPEGLDPMDEWDEEARAAGRLEHIEVPVGVWNATAGPIKIVAMCDEHLKNAIAWLERYGLHDTAKAAELCAEQECRRAMDRSVRLSTSDVMALSLNPVEVRFLAAAVAATENDRGAIAYTRDNRCPRRLVQEDLLNARFVPTGRGFEWYDAVFRFRRLP
jgi:hypothetical protein